MSCIVNQDGDILSTEYIMKERYKKMKEVFDNKAPEFISKLSTKCREDNHALQIHKDGDKHLFILNGSQAWVLKFSADRVTIDYGVF